MIITVTGVLSGALPGNPSRGLFPGTLPARDRGRDLNRGLGRGPTGGRDYDYGRDYNL
jgi:hypothetical protein